MNYSRIEKNDIQIKGVTGNKIQLEGRCNIEVYLGGQKAIIPIFIASNIQQKFILGYDIMKKLDIKIDISGKCFIFQNKIIPFITDKNKAFSVSIAKTVLVPRYSKWTIPVKIGNKKSENKNILVQTAEVKYFKDRPEVSIHSCVLQNKQTVTNILIENNSSMPITFKKGHHIAVAEIIEAEEILNTDKNLFSIREVKSRV